jgi:hypothetical protein
MSVPFPSTCKSFSKVYKIKHNIWKNIYVGTILRKCLKRSVLSKTAARKVNFFQKKVQKNLQVKKKVVPLQPV